MGKCRRNCEKLVFKEDSVTKTLNNRTGGPNNEYRGGPGGPGSGFGGPRGGLDSNRNIGRPLLLLLRKTTPGITKTTTRTTMTTPGLVLWCFHYTCVDE